MNIFFLVLARDSKYVDRKIAEIESFGFPFKIICGERIDNPNVVYHPPKGKFDAINFSVNVIPANTDIVVMNDVDTKIHNVYHAIKYFNNPAVTLVFGTELVKRGPQNLFFRILNPIRKILPVAGSGELMLIRYSILMNEILPLKTCKSEDTYILFKLLQLKRKIVFCEECYAETKRTKLPSMEEAYKRRTVAGIYQALSYTRPPLQIQLFYWALPFFCPLLLVVGTKGYYWIKGIWLGLTDYIRGDRLGTWLPIN
jgi:cellulose synthase/poly-beta-1,6-N-acetylglucosamine synthase-like glycosyltransferase